MALTTIITGRMPATTDLPFKAAELVFTLSDWDKAGGDVFPPAMARSVLLTSDGTIPAGFALWRNSAGQRSTTYIGTARWSEEDRQRGQVPRETPLGRIYLTGPGPVALADLLAIPAPVPNVPDALAQALGAAAASEIAAGLAVPAAEMAHQAALDAQEAVPYSVDNAAAFFARAADKPFPTGVVAAKSGETWQIAADGEYVHPTTSQRYTPLRPASQELSAPAFNARAEATDQLVPLNRMLARGGRLHLGIGEYGASSVLYIPSNTTLTFDKAARIMPTVNGGGQMRIGGAAPASWTALASDVAKGAYEFPAVAGSVVIGDWIEFRSTGLVPGLNTQADRRCHIAKVIAISGSTAFIDRPFYYDFLVADTAVWGKATVRENIVIDGASINRLDSAFTVAFGFYLAYVASFKLVNIEGYRSKATPGVDGAAGVSMIRLSQCLDGRIEGADVGQVAWYGIAFGGFNDNIVVDGVNGRDCRHTVSVVNGNGDPANPSYGETHNLTVRSGHSRESVLSGFDTHSTGQNISFVDCQAFGSLTDSGFQIRNIGTKLIRPRAQFNYNDGIVARDQGAQDLYIEDPLLTDNGRSGASLVHGQNPKIVGGVVGRNVSNDLQICDGTIIGTRFEKTTANTVPCVLHSSPADGSRNLLNIIGVTAPAPAAGHIFCGAALERMDLIRLRDNNLSGYGSNAYRVPGSASGDAVISLGGSRISNPGVTNNGSLTLTAGGTATITIADTVQLFRNQGPSYVPEINFFRYGTTAPVVDRGLLFIAQIGNSGTSTILTIKSTSPTDFGTFRWTLVS